MRKKLFNKAVTGVLAAAMVVTLGGGANLSKVASAADKTSVTPTTVKRASYRAYMVLQTQTYMFRDFWYDTRTGENYLGLDSEKLKTQDGKFVTFANVTQIGTTAKTTATDVNPGGAYTVEFEQAHITKPGRYQVSLTLPDNLSNLFDFDNKLAPTSDSKTPFLMIGVGTDIPKKVEATFKDIELISDGETKTTIPEAVRGNSKGNGAVKNDQTDYWEIMALNQYDTANNTVVKTVEGFTTAPKKSLIVRFTVEGDIFDPAGGDSDSTPLYKSAVKFAQDNVPGFPGSKSNAGFDESGNEIIETDSVSATGEMTTKTTSQQAVQAVANTDTSNLSVGPAAGASSTVKNAKYTVLTQATNSANGSVAYAGASGKLKKAKKITVPAAVTIEGHSYAVTTIAKNAFKGVKAKTIVIPKSVTTISKGAFNKDKKLRTLKFGAKLATVEKKAFVGMNQKVKITGAARKANLKLVKKAGLKKAR